jgi:O-antigen/teichoic acid export membrane protein
MATTAPGDEPRQPPAAPSHEGATALRNALKLGSSLVLTWGVALVTLKVLPEYLGTSSYGSYVVGDQWGQCLAAFLTLGVDTYISREIAVRPKHASDFFGALLVTRLLVLVPLVLYTWFVWVPGRAPEVQTAGKFFSIGYVFYAFNQTFQQMLQAASKVSGLAIANVISKVLWGGGTLALALLKAPFWSLMIPLGVAEILKLGVLWLAAKEAVDLELRIDLGALKRVLVVAFPFYVANVAVTLGAQGDVVVLEYLLPKASPELGVYGAAQKIAKLSALLSPILSGVLIPMMSRAKARSEDDFFRILRRGMEGVNVVTIPLTLLLALGAELAVRVLVGTRFGHAAESLRFLAPTFVLSYANVLLWVSLMILGRSWSVALASLFGLALLPALVYLVVPLTLPLGPGGAAMGCGIAMSLRELVNCVVQYVLIGRRAVDARVLRSTFLSLVICAAVIVAHRVMAPLGQARLVVDAALYGALALVLRVIRPGDMLGVLQMIRDRKKPAAG